MYWILRENKDKYIWDAEKQQMYQVDEANECRAIKPTLEQLQRHKSELTLERKTNEIPPELKRI